MKPQTLSEAKQMLQNPDNTYRTQTFWSWNGDLQEEELNHQLAEFKDKGVGGFFMHAREGLETPYLSEQWKDRIRSCAEEGKRLGLHPYIYDDDKWPSGMAGGKVAAVNPDFRAMAIVLTKKDSGSFCYGAQIAGKTLLQLHEGEPSQEETPLYIDVQYSETSDWYNGSTPANNLNPESVRAFLDMTHEQYKKLFDGKLSDYVDGFFTDEPNFADFFATFEPHCPWLPWTADFDVYFQEKRGYSIIPLLPYLFYQGEQAPKVRHDYWRTITELFSQTYFKQIYDWCEENGVINTGHMLFENGLCSQARVCGAAMPHFQYLHIPGVDILGERTEEYLTVKQCTSVAHQMGRRAVSESYGCTGWQLSFEGQKWLWDWQAVQGISVRCPHLAQYSIKGLRKRDYPPVFNYQAAWWEHNNTIEDYCARLNVCADTGSVQRPILLLHPQSSVWLRCGSDPEEDLSHFDSNMGWTDAHIMDLNQEYDRISRLAQAMLKNQCDFDFGDEMLMAEHGCVNGKHLKIGKAEYAVVVVPAVQTLFASTLDLLIKFAQNGGRILWLEELPGMVDGVPSQAVRDAFADAAIARDEAQLMTMLEPYRLVKITDILTHRAAPLLTSWRKTEDGYLLIAVNNDRNRGYRCRVAFPETGAVERFDLLTGEMIPMVTDGFMGIYEDFGPADTRVYLLHTQEPAETMHLKPVYHDVHESPAVTACLGPKATFTRTDPNVLTLDRCSYKTDGTWSDEMAVWQAQRAIREQAGFQPIHANGMPMRYGWIYEEKPHIKASFQFTFVIEELPETPVYVALEERQAMRVFSNGTLCEQDAGWYKDRAIRKVKLENLREGENRIVLDVDYSHALEIEDIYILGDFAVNEHRHIVNEPETLRFGDWCQQGYPHYAGSMTYHFVFEGTHEQAKLHLGDYSATLVVASVNKGEPIYIPWRSANEPAVQLRQGINTLDLTVVGSNRNMFGPLHQPYQLCSRIDWQDFRKEETGGTEDYVLYPYGLMSQCYMLV